MKGCLRHPPPGGALPRTYVPLAATEPRASTAVGLQTHPKRTSRANACAAPAQLCQQAGTCVPDAPCFGRRGGARFGGQGHERGLTLFSAKGPCRGRGRCAEIPAGVCKTGRVGSTATSARVWLRRCRELQGKELPCLKRRAGGDAGWLSVTGDSLGSSFGHRFNASERLQPPGFGSGSSS